MFFLQLLSYGSNLRLKTTLSSPLWNARLGISVLCNKIDGHTIDGQVTQLMYDVEDWKPNLSRCQHSQKNSAVISVTHVAWQKNAYQTELLFQVSQWLFFFIYVTSLMFITHLFWAVGFLWVETQSWNWNTFEFPKSKDSSLRYDCKKCSLTIFWYIDINAAISSPNNRIEKHLSLSLNIKKIQGMDFTKETWKYLCLAETIESLRSIFCYFNSNLDVYNVCFFNNYFIMGLKTYLGSQLRNTWLWITLTFFTNISKNWWLHNFDVHLKHVSVSKRERKFTSLWLEKLQHSIFGNMDDKGYFL